MKEKLVPTPTNLISLIGVEEGIIPSKEDPIFENNYKGIVQKGGERRKMG